MRIAVQGATCLVAACLLGGCASSPAVRQAKQTDPIIVVTVQSTPGKKKTDDKPQENKKETLEKALKEAEQFGLIGVLGGTADTNDAFGGVAGGVAGGVIGGVPGGVLGSGSVGGFGGLGLSGSGLGGGGTGQGFGLGSIGTIGRGSGYAVRGNQGERAKAKIGHVVVTGPLMVDVVQRQIDEHRDDFQRCHRLEQAETGLAWGTVTLVFMIDPTGHVSAANIFESTSPSRRMESCLAHAMGGVEFPPPGVDKTVTVIVPVTF